MEEYITVYTYDENTKEFLYTQLGQMNPISKTDYLMPANSTIVAPPVCSESQAQVFENGEWVIKTDHREHYQVKLDDITFSKVDYIGNARTGYQFISDEVFTNYQDDNDRYEVVDGVFTDVSDTPEYIAKKAQQEQDRINNLTMTPLDFIGVLLSMGLTLEQINAFLESHLEIKIQLTYCSNVYCGVVKQFLPMTVEGIEITAEMVEQAFKVKNGVV